MSDYNMCSKCGNINIGSENCSMCEKNKENKELKERLDKAIDGLKEISKYETCWKCKHYYGGSGRYCAMEGVVGGCDRNRSGFLPTESVKIRARKTLEDIKESK